MLGIVLLILTFSSSIFYISWVIVKNRRYSTNSLFSLSDRWETYKRVFYNGLMNKWKNLISVKEDVRTDLRNWIYMPKYFSRNTAFDWYMMRENNTMIQENVAFRRVLPIFECLILFSDLVMLWCYFVFGCWVLLYVLCWFCSLLKTTLIEILCSTRYMAFLGLYWWELLWFSRYASVFDVIGLLMESNVTAIPLTFLIILEFVKLQIFTFSPKKSTNIHLMLRFFQGVTALGLVAALCLVVALTDLSVPDLFASVLAFVATGWAVLCVSLLAHGCFWILCAVWKAFWFSYDNFHNLLRRRFLLIFICFCMVLKKYLL